MSLPLPNLDDRRWADLVEEGRALIPVYAPEEWTDHNVHDPGITLMELFAWIAEMDLYQLNRIPERHKRKFLALVGIQPVPPRPSHAVLSFKLKNGDSFLTLPASTEFEGNDPSGQATRFRTLDEVNVVPGELSAVQFKDQGGCHDLTGRWKRGEKVALFGDAPKPGAELYLGFTQPFPKDTKVSLFFTFSDWQKAEEERERLIEEIKAQREACRSPDSLLTCDEKQPPSITVANDDCKCKESEQTLVHHSVRTVWEFLAGQEEWQVLDPAQGQVEDNTRNFTLNGWVLVNLQEFLFNIDSKFQKDLDKPIILEELRQELEKKEVSFSQNVSIEKKNSTWLITDADNNQKYIIGKEGDRLAVYRVLAMAKARLGQVESELYYIRCRFLSGAYDAAPALNNLVLNGVLAEQAVPVGDFKIKVPDSPEGETKLIGQGTGYPNQRVTLSEKPVVESGFRLFTIEDGKWLEWALQSDFDASDRIAFHFLLDPTQGTVTFGDGERGRVVPDKASIVVSYSATRAEEGNLPANAIRKLAKSIHNQSVLSKLDSDEKQRLSLYSLHLGFQYECVCVCPCP